MARTNKVAVLIGLILTLGGAYISSMSIDPTIDYVNAVFGIVVLTAGFIFLARGVLRNGRARPMKVAFDLISIVLTAFYFMAILFGGLGGLIGSDQASQNLSNFLLGMGVVAIVMMLISGVFSLAPGTNLKTFSNQVLYIGMSFGGFLLLNAVVRPTVPIFFPQSLATANNFVTLVIAIPEELLFRGWLTPWIGNISKTGIAGGAIGSGFLFMVYHLFVYGTDLSALIIVFLAGVIQGIAAIKTGRLSTTMTTHIINNGISISGAP